QYIRVPKEWVIKKPSNISLKELMVYGTAGFTAALSVDKLLRFGINISGGDVIVTGATGGVGLFSIGILKKLGFDVVAVTGKKDKGDFLRNIGAKDVIGREDVEDSSGKPLLKPKWNAAVDSVGGSILSSIICSMKYGGAVAVCGLAQSPKLDITVFPFILRGVSILGIDSVELHRDDKEAILHKISNEYKIDDLSLIYTEVYLEDIKYLVPEMLKGNLVGRYIVKID
ncbi:MAG: zinc-binding dehydrogenase, partial [Calditerrivibrio sp.]|nr:zinc-binding dehydrogenase [Calditerrivibrio sp.]